MIERDNPLLEPIERGNPLLELTREPRKMEEKRPVLRRSIHVLFTKKLSKPIERGNPLLKQVEPKHVHLMTARVSTLKWHMIERGNPLLKHTENVPEGSQTRSCHESISFNVGDETIRDRTRQPVVNHDESSHEQTMLNEVNMDFRIPGLPHSVLKQADNYRVRELVKKIENHPHRHSLQRDLHQNKACIPFRATSKKMIQDMCIGELFELFETDPKTQCKECFSYWSEGVVYCTCGHLLKESAAHRSFIVYTLDFLSIPEYVIKKGRLHGHRYGKTPQQKEYHQAHNLKRRCIKRGYQGIHDRFLIDSEFRASQLEHDRDQDVCIKMDELADKNFTHYMTQAEYFRYKQIGGSLSISLETLDHWEIVLTL